MEDEGIFRMTETITVRARSMLALFAIASLCVVVAPPRARTEAGAHPVVDQLAGTYRNRLSDGGEARIAEAIEEGTASMRRLRRKIARRRLHAVNPPVERMTIAPNGEGARVVYEGSRDNRTPKFGVFVESRSADGGKVDVMHEIAGDRLVERYRKKDGTGKNVLSLSEDGRELILHVTIESDQLPGPIRYRLEFERVGG